MLPPSRRKSGKLRASLKCADFRRESRRQAEIRDMATQSGPCRFDERAMRVSGTARLRRIVKRDMGHSRRSEQKLVAGCVGRRRQEHSVRAPIVIDWAEAITKTERLILCLLLPLGTCSSLCSENYFRSLPFAEAPRFRGDFHRNRSTFSRQDGALTPEHMTYLRGSLKDHTSTEGLYRVDVRLVRCSKPA